MAELRNGFSWSATRHTLFSDCQRAYFFQYYLSTGRAVEAEPSRSARAGFLKHLTTIPLWVGSEVHEAIEDLLRVATRGGTPDPQRAVLTMKERMRRSYTQSRANVAGGTGDSRQYTRFFEHEYQIEIKDEVWKERVEEADQMVHAFSALPYIELAKQLAPRDLLGLERLEKWSIDDVPVWVKIDFAFRDPEARVHILDWKTGKFERGENPLQMVGYACYATQAWGATLASLRVREVYLRQAQPEKHCVLTQAVLDRGEATIRESIGEMQQRLADRSANTAQESEFSLAADEKTCRNCFFRAICPRWSEA
jgi:hypothetical protein